MADVLRQLKEGGARHRKGSLRDTESRQEEEGGQQNEGVLKLVEPKPVIKFLKKCLNISTLIFKFSLAVVLFMLLLNLLSAVALHTVKSDRLSLFKNNDTVNITASTVNGDASSRTVDGTASTVDGSDSKVNISVDIDNTTAKTMDGSSGTVNTSSGTVNTSSGTVNTSSGTVNTGADTVNGTASEVDMTDDKTSGDG